MLLPDGGRKSIPKKVSAHREFSTLGYAIMMAVSMKRLCVCVWMRLYTIIISYIKSKSRFCDAAAASVAFVLLLASRPMFEMLRAPMKYNSYLVSFLWKGIIWHIISLDESGFIRSASIHCHQPGANEKRVYSTEQAMCVGLEYSHIFIAPFPHFLTGMRPGIRESVATLTRLHMCVCRMGQAHRLSLVEQWLFEYGGRRIYYLTPEKYKNLARLFEQQWPKMSQSANSPYNITAYPCSPAALTTEGDPRHCTVYIQ